MNEMWRETHHTAICLAGSKGSDHKRDVQVSIDPPALIATLQTTDVILQLPLVQLVDQVSLRMWRHDSQASSAMLTCNNMVFVLGNKIFFPCYIILCYIILFKELPLNNSCGVTKPTIQNGQKQMVKTLLFLDSYH